MKLANWIALFGGCALALVGTYLTASADTIPRVAGGSLYLFGGIGIMFVGIFARARGGKP